MKYLLYHISTNQLYSHSLISVTLHFKPHHKLNNNVNRAGFRDPLGAGYVIGGAQDIFLSLYPSP